MHAANPAAFEFRENWLAGGRLVPILIKLEVLRGRAVGSRNLLKGRDLSLRRRTHWMAKKGPRKKLPKELAVINGMELNVH